MQGLVVLAIAAVCAALMGFAVQRGATCMVAAVDEIVSKKSANRLIAMLEASAIVACGIVIARFAGHLGHHVEDATVLLLREFDFVLGELIGIPLERACRRQHAAERDPLARHRAAHRGDAARCGRVGVVDGRRVGVSAHDAAGAEARADQSRLDDAVADRPRRDIAPRFC